MNDKMFINEFTKVKSQLETQVKSLSNWRYEEFSKVKQTIKQIIHKASDLESLIDQKEQEEELEL